MKTLHPSRQSGLSLVELMVAIVLGLLLIGGVLQIFLSSNKTYKTNLALSEVQEAGRFAMEFLTFDIRNASYRGECVGSLNKLNYDERYQLTPGIKGWKVPTSTPTPTPKGAPDTWQLPEGFPGTDIILIKHAANSAGVKITSIPDSSIARSIPAGELLVISEPVGCDIFVNPGASSENSSVDFRYNYSQKAELLKYQSSIYYIDKDTRSLRRISYSKPNKDNIEKPISEELVQGIQDLQIKYAQGGDSTGNIVGDYVDADDISDWSSVIAVKINLTAVSSSKNLGPNDQPIKQVFSTTVGIRNRLP